MAVTALDASILIASTSNKARKIHSECQNNGSSVITPSPTLLTAFLGQTSGHQDL